MLLHTLYGNTQSVSNRTNLLKHPTKFIHPIV